MVNRQASYLVSEVLKWQLYLALWNYYPSMVTHIPCILIKITSVFKILLNSNNLTSHFIPVKIGLIAVPSFPTTARKSDAACHKFPMNMNMPPGTAAGEENRDGSGQTHYCYCKSTCPPEGESHIKTSLFLCPYFYSPDESGVTLL